MIGTICAPFSILSNNNNNNKNNNMAYFEKKGANHTHSRMNRIKREKYEYS